MVEATRGLAVSLWEALASRWLTIAYLDGDLRPDSWHGTWADQFGVCSLAPSIKRDVTTVESPPGILSALRLGVHGLRRGNTAFVGRVAIVLPRPEYVEVGDEA